MAVLSPEVLERISDAFVAVDCDWRYTYVNRKAGELFGKDPKSLLGVHLWTDFPQGVGQPFQLAFEKAMREQIPATCEHYHELLGRWFENRIYPSVDGLSVFFTEITERKRVERTLREQALVFRQISDAVIIADTNGVITGWNPAAEHLFGFSAEEALGQTPESLHPAEPSFAITAEALRAVDEAGGWRGDVTVVRKDGSRGVFQRSLQPVRDCGDQIIGTVGVHRDVTRERQAEALLRASQERAQDMAERMRAVAGIASAVLGARTFNDLDRVLREACLQVLPHDVFTFGIYDEADHVLHFISGWDGGTFEPGESVPLEGKPSERVIRERQSLLTLRADDPAAQGAAAFGTQTRSESIIRTPILSGERVLGIISVQSYVRDFYTADSVEVLEAFAAVVASAVENIELLEKREHAEARLRASEERYRAIFEYAPHGIIEGELDGTELRANPALQRMLDMPARIAPADFQRLTHPEDAAAGRALFAELLAGERDHHRLEKRYLRPDGSVLWAVASASIVRGEGGTPTHVFAIIADVSERKHAEEALRKSEELFRSLVESSKDLIDVFSPEGDIRYGNASVEAILGYPRDTIVGRNVLDYVHPEDLPRMAGALHHRARNPGVGVEMEFRMRHVDGSWRTLEATGHNLLDQPAVQGLLVTGRDITDRRELEKQLRQAQKMEAVGRLAGGVAHDFNNMLQVIGGFAAFLEAEVKPGSEAVEYVHEIRKAADRAASLTRQLLAFGRRQVLQPKVLDLNTVVESAGGMLRRLIPASIEMETRLTCDLGVDVDPVQIQQVLMNLVVNARDAMPDGGTLGILTENRSITARHRRVLPFLKEGEYASLVVRDSGCGIDEATLSHIFEPFFTTKPMGEGTGLGLATVYGIVKQSGGYVWAESEPGRGSTFTVLLPPVRRSKGPDPIDVQANAVPQGSGTILLAEDDDAVRALARLAMERAGYTVVDAPNGSEALRIAEERAGAFDLVVTDVIMPKMGGKELAMRLREIRPTLPVIFMSGYAGDVLADDGSLPTDTNFVAKPFQPAVLAEMIKQAMQRVGR